MTFAAPTTVVQLAPADLPVLRELNALFADAFEDLESYVSQPPSDTYLRAWLGKSHAIALAAYRSGALAGGLVAYELEKFEQARSEIYIYDLAVAEAHRRCGVATALIAKLQSLAAERGAHVIFVQADYGDDPAVALYEKLGAREDVMHFDIPVTRPA